MSDISVPTYLVLLLILPILYQIFRSDNLSHVPGPWVARYTSLYKLWLVLDGNAPQYIRELHDKYGRVVRAGPRDVYIADAGLIPAVFAARLPKTRLYEVFDISWRGHELQVPLSARDPAVHAPMRQSLARKLSPSAVRGVVPHIRRCVLEFADRMAAVGGGAGGEGPVAATPVDAYAWLQHWSYDTSAACTFGSPFGLMAAGADRDGLFDSIDGGFKYATFVGQVPGLHGVVMALLAVLLFPKTRVLRRPDRPVELLEALEKKLEECRVRKTVSGDQDTYLDRILAESALGQSAPFEEVITELFTLVASNATAIGTLLAVLYNLAHNPEHQAALYDEIQQRKAADGCEAENMKIEDFAKMTFMNAVIKEALRICPAAALPLERVTVDEGLQADGITIPPEVNVSICPNVIHRDREIFGPDCDVFDPHRWLRDDADSLKKMERSLLSFGYGTRACGGRYMAMVEMSMFLAVIFDRFDIQPDPAQPRWNLTHFWVPQAPGTLLIFQHR